MRRSISVLGLVAVAGLAACGGSDKPEPATPANAPKPQAAPLSPAQEQAVAEAESETGATGLGISDEILQLCPEVKPPRFGYDSAKVKQEFTDTLRALADCMNNGGLKGRDVLLVGHADPRGEPDYNQALGGRRAESVRKALNSLGVATERLDLSSRGETDAQGTDEESWAKDRRVDIKLKMSN